MAQAAVACRPRETNFHVLDGWDTAAMTAVTLGTRDAAHEALVANYERLGWKQVEPIGDDSVVAVAGPGGVTFHGRAVGLDDIANPEFAATLKRLSATRMPTGQLCPLDLMPSGDAAAALRSLLREMHIDRLGHVSIYGPPR